MLKNYKTYFLERQSILLIKIFYIMPFNNYETLRYFAYEIKIDYHHTIYFLAHSKILEVFLSNALLTVPK